MSKSRSSRPVQHVDRHAVEVVALDANVFGKDARFTLSRIQAFTRDAAEADVDVWIPEIVAWELASNVADQHEAARESTRGADRLLRQAGVGTISLPFDNHAGVIAAVLGVLERQAIRIVKTTPDDAYLALKDQVQLAAPGRRKEGVKTGAADSAWVRSILREAQAAPSEEVVIVSADREVDSMIASLAPQNLSLALNWGELRTHLFEYGKSAEAAQALVRLGQLRDVSSECSIERQDQNANRSLNVAVSPSTLPPPSYEPQPEHACRRLSATGGSCNDQKS